MSSIFSGRTGLRHQFFKVTSAEFSGATNAATAVLVARFNKEGRLNFIDNTLDKDVALLLVHPDADASVSTNRLFWIEVPSNRVINYEVGNIPGLIFDPGTMVYAYPLEAASSGALRFAMWG